MKHTLSDEERAMLLAIAKDRHSSWRSQTLLGYSIQRSLTADRTKGFALVKTTARPDCDFYALMVVIQQHGTSTEAGYEHVMKDGTVLQLRSNVPVREKRPGWSEAFATMEDEPRFGRDRPAFSAGRSGRLWVEDAMHNSYELSEAEIADLLLAVTPEQRALLERIIAEAQNPNPA